MEEKCIRILHNLKFVCMYKMSLASHQFEKKRTIHQYIEYLEPDYEISVLMKKVSKIYKIHPIGTAIETLQNS